MATKSVEQINRALSRLFNKHRIVFWFDDKDELRKDFDAVEIDGVEKVEIKDDEFALKWRILRTEPKQKFLLFRVGPEPEYLDNWLLDVQLAHRVFSTDQATIWLTELGLPYELKPIVQSNEHFFNAAKRRDALRKRLETGVTPSHFELRRKMLAVCANCPGTDSRLDSILENLLEEVAETEEKNERFELVTKCNLDGFLFEQMKNAYSYDSDAPGIRDFMIELFKSCYAMGTEGEIRLGSEALVFLKRWKNNRNHEQSFETLSSQCEQLLNIKEDLEKRESEDLIDLDYFRLIDVKILHELIQAVLTKTISADKCRILTRSRRTSHWYREFEHIYEAVNHAAEFISLISALNINIDSLGQGAEAYVCSLFRIDQLYRKFTYHFKKSNQPSFFDELSSQVCNMYNNSFLLPLGDRWQQLVDQSDRWAITNVSPQRKFFDQHVKKFIDKKKKVYVIISDAMRYEIGAELASRIAQENRFEAEVKHMATGLPSYTQLGMASLLPNETLAINSDKTATVNVDGHSSSGIVNRRKLLESGTSASIKTTAITSDTLLGFNKDQARELVRDHNVVYVYHDVIDDRGDDRASETQVFAATEEALDDLVKMVTKLTSANATNLLITADHGFIYQEDIEESEFSTSDVGGDEVTKNNRRFKIGKGLTAPDGVNRYEPSDIGLSGDLQVIIPKSINRFRLKGAGYRYVHGGSTLQETIVPVLHVRKRKKDDTKSVDVDLLPTSTTVISTGQMSFAFYQAEPISEKVRPRFLEVGLWVDNEPISDLHELKCDLTAENPRDREQKLRLVLSKEADSYNGKQVMLKLRERHRDTSHFEEYKSYAYTLRRSFTTDFDDFG